ncbi:MAG TPA: excinuclease ABC subunit UvrC [Bacteroidia bacterium]|nr:excinuclease ABC subunit UvrC [Bacteroidia bacterium]
MNKSEHIQTVLSGLPDSPGVYQFYNPDEQLLYVGKAKNLKKRVYSYFAKQHDSNKLNVLVKQITDIKYILVETEYDALLLENNLIKKHQPRYNVNLKDDKTYPWIIIKNERFPRIFYTRKFIRDGSTYFGPYASVGMIHVLFDLIGKLFKLRNCNLNLSKENIEKKKFKVCLEYHIGNCKGPCEALQTEEDYNNTISEIREILKGNTQYVINHLKDLMQKYSELYDFEKAQQIKDKIEMLEKYQSKSVVVHPTIHNVDVFSIVNDDNTAYVNFLKVMNGAIIQAQTIELKKKLDEKPEELLSLAIAELRQRYNSTSDEVLVPLIPETEIEGITFTIPKIGDKKHLLDLSFKNAMFYKKEKLSQLEKLNPDHKTERVLAQMMKDLRLKELPRHIECFDNSNMQGSFPVAAMSVFKDGRPSKSDYRHFNIKTVEGPDDFASMEEVIYRRYKRILDEKQSLPQLIVIDGGKGQLSSAMNSLEKLNLTGKIAVIGIAKKLEEIYYPHDSVPLYLDKKGETLRLIQYLRDEVHRFGITHHRKRRNKGVIKTELSEIRGIGDATSKALLRHFKSVKKIREASYAEMEDVIGKAKARVVFEYFGKEAIKQ